jgi:hypothetical protein
MGEDSAAAQDGALAGKGGRRLMLYNRKEGVVAARSSVSGVGERVSALAGISASW